MGNSQVTLDTPTGRTVSEAREALGYIPPEDFPEFSDDLARLIAAVRNETIRAVRAMIMSEMAHDDLCPQAFCDCNKHHVLAALDALVQEPGRPAGLVVPSPAVTIASDAP